MAKDRLSMRTFKEVLRLKFDHQLTNRKIAKSCAISHVTVGKYLDLAKQAGITWPLPMTSMTASSNSVSMQRSLDRYLTKRSCRPCSTCLKN